MKWVSDIACIVAAFGRKPPSEKLKKCGILPRRRDAVGPNNAWRIVLSGNSFRCNFVNDGEIVRLIFWLGNDQGVGGLPPFDFFPVAEQFNLANFPIQQFG